MIIDIMYIICLEMNNDSGRFKPLFIKYFLAGIIDVASMNFFTFGIALITRKVKAAKKIKVTNIPVCQFRDSAIGTKTRFPKSHINNAKSTK